MQINLKKVACLFIVASILSPSIYAGKYEDSRITSKVEELFQNEKDLPSNCLKVHTYDSVVKLSGNLDTMLQANRAVELAYSVENVMDVDSNITITDSEQFIADAFITARAKGKVVQLTRDGKITKANNLHFETTNGTLHVYGTVGNKYDLNILKNELLKLKGVEAVKTNIRTNS